MEMIRPLHQGISVPDVDVAAQWYQDVFGFETEFKEYAAPLNSILLFLRLGDFELELFQYMGDDGHSLPAERLEPNEDLKTCGTKHVAYRVEDMDSMYEYLLNKKVDIAIPPFTMNTDKVCFIRDCYGTIIELIQK